MHVTLPGDWIRLGSLLVQAASYLGVLCSQKFICTTKNTRENGDGRRGAHAVYVVSMHSLVSMGPAAQ